MNDHLEESGLPPYKLTKKAPGSSEVIRKQSKIKMDHFELYSSIVHGHQDGSKVASMQMDIQIYEEQIEALKEENQTWNSTY